MRIGSHQIGTAGATLGDGLVFDPDVDELVYGPVVQGLTSDDSSVTITDNGDGTLDLAAAGGGGGGSLTVQDENGNVATGVTQIDFQGAGVTAAAGTGEVVVTVPGGGGGGGSTVRDFDNPADSGWGSASAYDVEFDTDDLTGTLPSGWSWVNQGTASYKQIFGAGVISWPGAASADHKMIMRAIPGAAAFTATIKARPTTIWNNIIGYGLFLRESSSGKLIKLYAQNNNGAGLDRWNSATSYNGNTAAAAMPIGAVPYFRVVKNSATSWDFGVSFDGAGWYWLVTAHNFSAFMTADQIGIGVHRQNLAATDVAFHWFRVR